MTLPTPQEITDFAKTAMAEYDAIVTLEQDAAFRAKLAAFVAGVQVLMGSGIVKFLVAQFQLQVKKLQDEIAKLTAPKAKK